MGAVTAAFRLSYNVFANWREFQKHLAIAGNLHQHRSFWPGNQTSRVTGLIRIAAMQ
jgi:hypothetical protein